MSSNRKFTEYDKKKLQEENSKLKCELEVLRNQYEWLLEEGKNECFDERRINLLKAQVMQLQRQVVLLTEGLSSRAAILLEMSEALDPFIEKLRYFLDCNSPTCEVPVERSELKQMIKTCQGLKSKLQKNYQATGIDELALPWLMSRKNFTKPNVTLLDLCYGKMENLNLQYVSALETKLSQLYRHLQCMKQTLNFILAPGQGSHKQSLQILPTAVYSRLINQMKRCNLSLEECCSDLLILTLIVPSAPWAKIQSASIPEFTVDSVLSMLPEFPKGSLQVKAKKAIEALLKATNYAKLMTMQQINALQAEVNFHRSIYNLQIKYTKAVFDAIKQAYHSFLANVDGVLCSPLRDVLSSYLNLKAEPSDTAFRDFLSVLKNNAEQIQEAVDTLTPSDNLQAEGDEVLSKFGREFFLSLEQSLRDCGEQRDKAAREMEVLRIELEQAITELQVFKKERKEKGMDHNLRFSKWKGEGGEAIGTDDMPTQLSISQFASHKQKLDINSVCSSKTSSLLVQEETIERAPSRHRGKNSKIKGAGKPHTPKWIPSLKSYIEGI